MMHPVKALYCRVVQLGFRIAMPILPYTMPKTLASVEQISDVLKEKKIASVLLVTDASIRGFGLTASLEENLKHNGIACAVYDRTCPNPTVENVEEALELYHAQHCNAIVAFGGGSAMDCAKGVGVRAVRPKKSLDQLKGLLRVLHKLPLLIAVPTTAGTGSEVTPTAVLTDPVKKHKYTMNDFVLIPDYAVLDAAVTYSLPKSLTATTGMDALTHAVEAYIGRTTNCFTRKMSLDAAKLVFDYIETAYNDGNNHTARKNMLLAAYKAGVAFSRSYVGYIHAVAHSLGGQYNIAHGLANSVLMPLVLRRYGASVHKKLYELAVYTGIAEEADTPAIAAEKFICAVEALNERMGIPKKLSGIDLQDIPRMARHADREANPLYPVPVLLDAKALEKIYYGVME